MSDTTVESPSYRRVLIGIIIAAFAARLAAVIFMGDTIEALPGIHDQIGYDTLAQSVVAGRGIRYEQDWFPFIRAHIPTALTSFLYVIYLASVYAVVGHHPIVARLIQALFGTMICVLAYRLGRRLFGVRAGLAASLLTAFYAFFIYYSAALMTQTLFTLGLMVALDTTLDIAVRPTKPKRVILGLALGATTLLRQSMMPFIALFLLWLLWESQGRIRGRDLLVTVSIVALLILPWTLRNYLVLGRFLLLNSEYGYIIWNSNHPEQGTNFDPGYVVSIPEKWRGWNEVDINNAMLREGIGFILQDPTRFARLSLSRIPVFFEFWPKADSPMISNISRVLSFGVTLPFMLIGLSLSLRHWRRYLLLYLFILGYTAIHLVSWASARYRLPMDAVLILFAGYAMVQITERLGWMARAPDAGDLSEVGMKAQGDLTTQGTE